MASINPFSYSSTFSDLHLSYSRWIVRKKELELDGMVHRAYNAFFMGSSKSKNKKSLRISIKISFAKVLIEKLWRILELRNQSCVIKYLIFKLIRQVGFFERSDKMTWFWNSKAKKNVLHFLDIITIPLRIFRSLASRFLLLFLCQTLCKHIT